MQEGSIDLQAMLGGAREATDFLKLLANPNRLMIACALVGRELSVAELEREIGLRQPALSQQIAELREAGMIVGRKQSKSVFYCLADGRVAEFVELLQRHFCPPGAADGTLQSDRSPSGSPAGTGGKEST
jgi:DNA-binding transcriptional ArsR family regulator